MRPTAAIVATAAAVVLAAPAGPGPRSARAGTTGAAGLRAALEAAEDEIAGAAEDLLAGNTGSARGRVAAAQARLADADAARGRALARDVRRVARRLEAAGAAVPTDPADVTDAFRALGRAATAARSALRTIGSRGSVPCVLTDVSPGGSVFRSPGATGRFRARAPGSQTVQVAAASGSALFDAIRSEVADLGRGRYAVRWGADAGRGRITLTTDAASAERPLVNAGPPGALSAPIPAAPSYPGPLTGRTGADIAPLVPLGTPAAGASWFADDLPDGLAIDPATGTVTGRPLVSGPGAVARVTVRTARAAASADVAYDVDPPLPAGVVALVPGFAAEPVLGGADVPVKLDVAADGRIFFNELATGRVRVVAAGGTPDPEPWAQVPVLTGGECGLLGLALAPDFATTGDVYVYVSTEAGDGKPRRNRVLRCAQGTGSPGGPSPVVVLDDLPLGPNQVQNGGDLRFGPDGNLYVTVGDTGDAALAQTAGSLAGRVLRVTPGGLPAAGNPVPGSPELCRGLRNSFDLAFSPSDGTLFATENGPTAHDELNVIRAGHNFEWGAEEGETFGVLTGFRVTDWTPVIAPTGLAFQPGGAFGEAFRGRLFVASYDGVDVRALRLDGIDLLSEDEFLRFDPDVFGNRPLDLAVEPDGSLLVSTFDGIWRVRRD